MKVEACHTTGSGVNGAAFADLHLHSLFSDGTYTPEEIAREAAKKGLRALALTDHDTVEGCPRTAIACQAVGIEFIAGTELTAEQDGEEIHILGFGMDLEEPRFLTEISRFQAVRQNRIREIVARLNERHVPLTAEAVFSLANCRAPGRPHVARALVKEGFCCTLDEAFERFLKRNRPAWVPKFKMSAREAVDLIHGAGGVAVMAHPGLNRADHLILSMVQNGLDGIECYHSKHSRATSDHYISMARRYGVLITGGSDCHGLSKGIPLIGSVRLPYEHVEKLKDKAAAWKNQVLDNGRTITPSQ
jgi:hypothetical protein